MAPNWQDKWHRCQCSFMSKAPRRISMRGKHESLRFSPRLPSVGSNKLNPVGCFFLPREHAHAHTDSNALTQALPREGAEKRIPHLPPRKNEVMRAQRMKAAATLSPSTAERACEPLGPCSISAEGLAFSLQLDLVILDVCQKEQQPSTYFTPHTSLPGCHDLLAEIRGLWWL